jgi:hypothetical protein
VFTGDGQSGTALANNVPKLKALRGHNAVYAFALLDNKRNAGCCINGLANLGR